jgi:hypothetical protein
LSPAAIYCKAFGLARVVDSHTVAGRARLSSIFASAARGILSNVALHVAATPRLSGFVAGQLGLVLLFHNHRDFRTADIIVIEFMVLVSYLASKIPMLSPWQRRQPAILFFLSRQTHWFWLQTAFFAALLCVRLVYDDPAFKVEAIVVLLTVFAASKLGCQRAGCCRAKSALKMAALSLPIAEFGLALLAVVAVLAFFAFGLTPGTVFCVGSVALLLIRMISLAFQRRPPSHIVREFTVVAIVTIAMRLPIF